MILLREIQERDLDALERLAQIPGFINLQNDRDFLMEKIQRSARSFRGSPKAGAKVDDSKYVFVAEDLTSGQVIGTSMIAAQHGTVDEPHFYFEVGHEEKYSKSIGTGFIHGTLKLRYDTNGPSEIGGLVIDPMFRNSEARLGRQISFVRFLFLALNRERFKRNLLAELLPPLNKKGQSPLWEAIGRRFTSMDYWEADRLCQQDKEFIFSLFPAGKIYTTFLPPEARTSIGKVGKDTEPVLHMLNKIGFRYRNQVDPFDGGPHLWAKRDELEPVQKTRKLRFGGVTEASAGEVVEAGLMTPLSDEQGSFRAMSVNAVLRQGELFLVDPSGSAANVVLQTLRVQANASVAFMPYY
ncbi:MAG: arginine N-succinyltransferase [Pseudomonadota bacterium]